MLLRRDEEKDISRIISNLFMLKLTKDKVKRHYRWIIGVKGDN